MKSTFKILFYLRSNHVNKKTGLSSIMIRITLDGKMKQFCSKMEVAKNLWDPMSGKVRGRSYKAQEINDYLEDVRVILHQRYREVFKQFGNVTVEQLKSAYLGVGFSSCTLLKLYDKKIDQKKLLVGNSISKKTLYKYELSKKVVSAFIFYKYKAKDFLISEVNYEFIKDYEIYLKSCYKVNHNYAVKQLRYLKQIIEDALKNQLLSSDPFYGYNLKSELVDKDFLIEPDIVKLLEWKFESSHLERVRDMFLFCCFTGLAYIDAYNLRKQDIITDADGMKWIVIFRTKSSIQANIPLLEFPSTVIKKYEGISEDRLLPMDTNQKMNVYLKEIAKICNINKKLTTHLARHSENFF